ncbi:MAG: hypothetical protein EOO52_12745 [Gammaproteobacteria bacterium]|nr:MAG: hypothetical protein EOO52_12745 [Gammaproteobacteria bacterium]
MITNSKIHFRTELPETSVKDEHEKIIRDFAEKNNLSLDDKHVSGFLDRNGFVSAVVKYDGWIHLLNKTEAFDGIDFSFSERVTQVPVTQKAVYEWVECIIHRKDRAHPIKVREHFTDLYSTEHDYWEKPNRVMRQIALSECARVAFGISGIRDEYSLPSLSEGIRSSRLTQSSFETPVRIVDTLPTSNVVPFKETPTVDSSLCHLQISDEDKEPIDKFISSITQHPAVFSTPKTIIDQLGTRYSGVALDYAVKVYEKAFEEFSQTSGAKP